MSEAGNGGFKRRGASQSRSSVANSSRRTSQHDSRTPRRIAVNVEMVRRSPKDSTGARALGQQPIGSTTAQKDNWTSAKKSSEQQARKDPPTYATSPKCICESCGRSEIGGVTTTSATSCYTPVKREHPSATATRPPVWLHDGSTSSAANRTPERRKQNWSSGEFQSASSSVLSTNSMLNEPSIEAVEAKNYRRARKNQRSDVTNFMSGDGSCSVGSTALGYPEVRKCLCLCLNRQSVTSDVSLSTATNVSQQHSSERIEYTKHLELWNNNSQLPKSDGLTAQARPDIRKFVDFLRQRNALKMSSDTDAYNTNDAAHTPYVGGLQSPDDSQLPLDISRSASGCPPLKQNRLTTAFTPLGEPSVSNAGYTPYVQSVTLGCTPPKTDEPLDEDSRCIAFTPKGEPCNEGSVGYTPFVRSPLASDGGVLDEHCRRIIAFSPKGEPCNKGSVGYTPFVRSPFASDGDTLDEGSRCIAFTPKGEPFNEGDVGYTPFVQSPIASEGGALDEDKINSCIAFTPKGLPFNEGNVGYTPFVQSPIASDDGTQSLNRQSSKQQMTLDMEVAEVEPELPELALTSLGDSSDDNDKAVSIQRRRNKPPP